MGMREMLILILGLVIIGVVLRGLFLALQARRGQIRLAIDKNIPQDVDLEELELSELPSGGARVVQRSLDEVNRQNSTQDELDLGGEAEQDGPIPMLMDTVEVREPSEYEAESLDHEVDEYADDVEMESYSEQVEEPEQLQELEQDSDDVDEEELEEESYSEEFDFDDDDSRNEPTMDSDNSFEDEFEDYSITAGERIGHTEEHDNEKAQVTDEPTVEVTKEPESTPVFSQFDHKGNSSQANVSIEETPEAEEVAPQQPSNTSGEVTDFKQAQESRKPATASEVKAARPAEPSEVLVINVMPRDGELFHGPDLVQVLITAGLKHGDMDIFHKHIGQDTQSPIVFSVANILNPGTFDMETIDEFTTRGLSLFLSLPSRAGNLEAFESMLRAAQQIRGALNGELKDDHRNVMTGQTIEHYRERIHDFELRKLKAAHAHS